jgi:uncharacterized Tic20 family protein
MKEIDVFTPPSRDARRWAMLCHLSAFIGLILPFGHLLGPLVMWQLKKEDDPYIDSQGKEALNFQITVSLWLLVSLALFIVLIGIPLFTFITFVGIAMTVIGAIKANKGLSYRYPFTLRLVK